MLNNYECLVGNFGFSVEDAKEVINFIVKVENIKDIESYDFSSAYGLMGARWDDEELLQDANEENEEFDTLEDILKWKNQFHRLPSGLILSWRY